MRPEKKALVKQKLLMSSRREFDAQVVSLQDGGKTGLNHCIKDLRGSPGPSGGQGFVLRMSSSALSSHPPFRP